MNNSSSIIDWLTNNQNSQTINIVQQSISLFFGLLIFLKSYDFESCLKSVRDSREAKRKAKEKAKLVKFQKMLELARANPSLDLSKIALSEDNESEEDAKNDGVLKMARRKQKREIV